MKIHLTGHCQPPSRMLAVRRGCHDLYNGKEEGSGQRVGRRSRVRGVLAIKLFAHQQINPSPNAYRGLYGYLRYVVTGSQFQDALIYKRSTRREVYLFVSQLANERDVDAMFTKVGFLDIEMDEVYQPYPIMEYRLKV